MRNFVTGCFAMLFAAVFPAAQAAAPSAQTLDAGWQVRLMPGDPAVKAHSEAAGWMAAKVPGAVQTDLISAGKLPDPYFGTNEAKVQWVGLSGWQYRRSLSVSAATLKRDHVDLVFQGLDTFATVRINGQTVLKADNMFRTWRVSVKGILHTGENRIEVDIASPIRTMAPKMAALKAVLPGAYDSAFGDEAPGRNSSTYVRKAGYHYGWDWGPRLVEIGIWKPVVLEAYDSARFADFHTEQQHLDTHVAALDAVFDIASDMAQNARVTVDVTAPDGSHKTVHQSASLFAGVTPVHVPLRIAKPQRWWPVGYGKPNLYTVTAKVYVGKTCIGSITRKIGLRTVEIRRQKDKWGHSFEFVVNGIPVFAKGANLIPFDMFPSRVTPAYQDMLLKSAVDANMNILRIWGGGIYQTDHVYEMADKLGLMIWQDFMFGGAIIPDDRHFRENTRIEAEEQVKRLRNHPSIVLWAGNNEVQTDWENWGGPTGAFQKSLTPEERDRVVTGMVRMFDNVLRSAVALYSPGTPYRASTPSTDYDGPADLDTDGDRHYWNVWGGKPITEYLNVTPRFMSEYGLQSFPEMATLKTIAKPEDLQLGSEVIHAHQKYDHGNGNTRLMFYIEGNYGSPKTFADFVYLSQVMQAEGIDLEASHLRAAMPQCMGSMYWQLNDVWPGASWSSIDRLGRWKALQYHAKRFYAPVIVTALRNKGVTSLHVVSDLAVQKSYDLHLRLMDVSGKVLSDKTQVVTVAPRSSLSVANLSDAELLNGHAPDKSYLVADLMQKDQRISRAVSYFSLAKEMTLPDPGITADLKQTANGYILTLHAAAFARALWVDFGDEMIRLSDNAFDMLPGETRKLSFTSTRDITALRAKLHIQTLYGAAK